MPTSPQDDRILVLGIGNILWADEGFGVRAVEEFQSLDGAAGWVRSALERLQ